MGLGGAFPLICKGSRLRVGSPRGGGHCFLFPTIGSKQSFRKGLTSTHYVHLWFRFGSNDELSLVVLRPIFPGINVLLGQRPSCPFPHPSSNRLLQCSGPNFSGRT